MLSKEKGVIRLAFGGWKLVPGPYKEPWWVHMLHEPTKEELEALEKQTRPCTDAWFTRPPYSEEVLKEQVEKGWRPSIDSIKKGFWAEIPGASGPEESMRHWQREVSTWDLPGLLSAHQHSWSLKDLWNYWTSLPMISKPKTGTSKATKDKGNKARLEQFIEAKRTARTLLEELGLPVPKRVEDFIHIRRAVGKFLAASSFITRNPIVVMELPVQPGHDSKAMLRERVICDERVTLNKNMFSHMPDIWDKISRTIPGNTVDVTVFYRCNTELWWVAKVEDADLRASFNRKLSQNSSGASGPEAVAGKEENVFMTAGQVPTADNSMKGDERNFPPANYDMVTSMTGLDYIKRTLEGTKDDLGKYFWFKCECGLVMSAVSQWEIKVKEACVSKGGYVCRRCAGMWKAGRGGSRGLLGKFSLWWTSPHRQSTTNGQMTA